MRVSSHSLAVRPPPFHSGSGAIGFLGNFFDFIEWASARVPPTPLLGGWLQLERSLDSAASSALLIERPAQKDRTQFDISYPVIIIPFDQPPPSSVLPFFFPGGSVRLLKIRIFQKSSRQWVRAPGHDMGPGKKYHTKEGPDFFA